MASTTNRMVEVRHTKTGMTTTVRETSWKNWGSAKAKDNDVRQGYVLVRSFTVDHAGKEIASDTPVKGKTFVPNLPPVPGQQPAKEEAKSVAPPAQPVQKQEPQGKADNLAAIPALGMKVQEALNASGIRTYKELAAADPEAIGKVLDGMVPPMSPKKAQVPTWQKAAKDFVKAAETPAV